MTTVLPGVPLVTPVPWPPVPPAGAPSAVPAPRTAEQESRQGGQPVAAEPVPLVPDLPERSDTDLPVDVSSARARRASTARATSKTASARSGVGEVLLTVAAVLGLVVTALTVFATTTGLKPLVVRSGSMEPTIATGAMVLVRTIPPTAIEVGDVVAVDRPDNTRVLHRVLEVEHRGATAEVVLKGDANEDPDPVPVVVDSASELVYSTPLVGRVSAFLASAKGGFALGSVVTAVLMTVLRRRR